MGKAKEPWFKEAEYWIQSYPELKRNLPPSPDLFTLHQFNRVDMIEQALSELNEEERKLLDLLYRQKKSYIAVSIAMHMSETTVYRAKIRLLYKLANRFGIESKIRERAQ
ncbi:sigma-70 family RNA polymerase sigma factor [Paenibacillus sp. oral taxon 786]|uniref:sigma-70 family RNA polymerase sigma factor n=1 Tax=Paenibacillus sp. oral taxon 786 TaxID=652715 RepID=UPI0002FD0DDE|nr:sigma-70 family RNA polymerase sigma factor [Paenibacillus sp. oral taxon 786]